MFRWTWTSMGELTIPVTLDGKELTDKIDTGASASILRADVAKAKFGLTPDSPGLEKAGTVRTLDGANLPVYLHRFATLAIEGVTFKNPVIEAAEDRSISSTRHRVGGPRYDMLLGMHQLRQLQPLFRLRRRALYATTIAGDAAASGQAVPTAALAAINDPVDSGQAMKLTQSAIQHVNAGEFQAAIADMDNAIALMPGGAWVYANRGSVYAQMGRT